MRFQTDPAPILREYKTSFPIPIIWERVTYSSTEEIVEKFLKDAISLAQSEVSKLHEKYPYLSR